MASHFSEQSAKAILEQLIRIRTTQPEGDEKDAVLFLNNLFDHRAVEKIVFEHGANRASLVVTLPGKNRKRSLAICGHLDTVSVDSTENWLHSPFSAFFDGERVYGRGAADMKGGVTSIVLVALKLLEENFQPENDIQFCFTADEEVGGTGAKTLCDSGTLDRVTEIVVVKPTNGRVGLAEKGALWLKVTANGQSAHAATPDCGINAVEQTALLAQSISSWLRKEGKYPLLGGSTCVVTQLHGGYYTNVVPEYAEGFFDIRTSPNISHGRLIEKISEITKEQMRKNSPLELSFEVRLDRPALGMDKDAPLVEYFKAVYKELKLPWETTGISYFTDASIFVPKLGVPFLIIGPGEEKFFHQPDEYVSLASVMQVARILEEYLRRYV